MYYRDEYITDEPNMNFLNELKNYFDDKDDDFSIFFFESFDEEKYLSYLNEAMKSLDYVTNEEDESSYHFFDYWYNAALQLFVFSLWQSRYRASYGDESQKFEAAKYEVKKFKEYLKNYNMDNSFLEEGLMNVH